jgi:hypothetical protein
LIRAAEDGSRTVTDQILIRWDRGRLEIEREHVDSVLARLGGMIAQSRSVRRSNPGIAPFPRRFVQILEHGTLRILIDRYNHFVVYDSHENLVCTFYVVRDEAAGLLVDGTWWGSRRLTGREPMPGAAERFARALLEAERAPERV